MDIPYGVVKNLVEYGFVVFPYNRYDYQVDLDVTEDGMILKIETDNPDDFINGYIQEYLGAYVELYVHLVACEDVRKIPFNK